jgi:hypothetical protein
VTPRGLGCAALALVLFAAILIGGFLFNLDVIRDQIGCPERLRWSERTYVAVGPLADDPRPGSARTGDPVRLGTTVVGMTGRDVYGPSGSEELPTGDERPEEIALDCGDGTFRSYEAES